MSEAQEAGEQVVVDWQELLSQFDGDRDVLRDIVDAYVVEIREHLEGLPQGIAAGDAAEVRRRAHTLKGSLRMFGVEPATERASALERAAARGELGGAAELFERARESAVQVLPVLQRFVETGEL